MEELVMVIYSYLDYCVMAKKPAEKDEDNLKETT